MQRSSLMHRIAIALVLLASPARGEILFTVNETIPDNRETGLQNTQTLSGFQGLIGSISVSLSISAASGDRAYNGDFYVTLQHDAGFAVLLNRVGVTAANPLGYNQNGFEITFALAAPDIHVYQDHSPGYTKAGSLAGTWGVDGRAADPDAVLGTSPRTDMLANFAGLDPNGTWTIFLADLSPYGNATLSSWGLDITPIPEPSTLLLIGLGALPLLRRRKKRSCAEFFPISRKLR